MHSLVYIILCYVLVIVTARINPESLRRDITNIKSDLERFGIENRNVEKLAGLVERFILNSDDFCFKQGPTVYNTTYHSTEKLNICMRSIYPNDKMRNEPKDFRIFFTRVCSRRNQASSCIRQFVSSVNQCIANEDKDIVRFVEKLIAALWTFMSLRMFAGELVTISQQCDMHNTARFINNALNATNDVTGCMATTLTTEVSVSTTASITVDSEELASSRNTTEPDSLPLESVNVLVYVVVGLVVLLLICGASLLTFCVIFFKRRRHQQSSIAVQFRQQPVVTYPENREPTVEYDDVLNYESHQIEEYSYIITPPDLLRAPQ
ncbi:hypothetical protein B566_EDAN009867 [Ephemera danica]|nr:hypothetical protein B566_EDAN009867 [Ephemera danica]